MSVINQMLKELEQRQGEQSSGSSQAAATQIQNKPSLKVTIAIVIIVTLLLNVIGLYIWNLYTENETLKRVITQPSLQNTTILKRSASITNKVDENKANEEAADDHFEKILEKKEKNDIAQVELSIQRSELIDTPDHDVLEQNNNKEIPVNSTTSVEDQSKLAVSALQTKNTVATPITKSIIKSITKLIPEAPNNPSYQPKKEYVGIVNQEVSKPSLSISRSKPSAESIVKKSLEKAERAILDKEIPKAEQLFEDILLIQPEHKDARKQLSALWFGRKLFQPALNLLSKGVELYPSDVDFRLMKARVLLSQNYNKEAFYVLNGYATVQHAQYQALLATTAESLGNVQSVILAYKQLVKIEEHKGKWWLGLAVALDRDSQFTEAKIAYETALSKGSLSSNSAQFVRQRMTELGE